MTFPTFIKDKFHLLILNIACAVFLSLFLYFTGTGHDEIILIFVCWALILFLYMAKDYWKLNKRLSEMKHIMETLDKKYLFPEMMGKPSSATEQEYFIFMKRAMKSMTEHVSAAQRKQSEYQQFIEQWIHEIKRPITASKLLCENNKNNYTRKLISQVEEIERHVERVLYYARLGYVEKDYIIKKTALDEIIEEVLAKNKQLLIQNNVRVDTSNLRYTVYSDQKWIVFMLNQIIMNCVQYKKDEALITISAVEQDNRIELSVWDNGIGIKESEIDRIFQLGFTGSNGRNANNSTGIGLYLCKELCKKLGIDIRVLSELNKFTEIILSFPKVKQSVV